MRKHNLAAAILFCGFLYTIAAGYLLLPSTDFSEMEKRYLAEAPDFHFDSVVSGKWSKEAETYLSDHVPLRNFFVGVNSYVELFAGRQHLKDVWLEEGKLLEAPVALNQAAIDRNMKAIANLAQITGRNIHVMVVPTAGWAAGVEGYDDEASIQAISSAASEGVIPVPVLDIYRGNPDLYYDTDHHWTSQGAHLGYQAFTRAVGRESRAAEDFEVSIVEDFRGSTYSRSALWLTPAEEIQLWHGSDKLTVTNGETEGVHDGIFYYERLEDADKYAVFMDGNHSIVRVRNPDKEGKLLVIRDSYSNCMGGFLAESYGEVVLIDLRYYRSPVSVLMAEEGFDDILVCYNCANFLTDTNLMLLR